MVQCLTQDELARTQVFFCLYHQVMELMKTEQICFAAPCVIGVLKKLPQVQVHFILNTLAFVCGFVQPIVLLFYFSLV